MYVNSIVPSTSVQNAFKLGIGKKSQSNIDENVNRLALKILTVALSLAASYSLVGMSTEHIETTFFKILIGAAFFSTLFSCITWSYHNLIDDASKRIKHIEHEEILLKQKKRKIIPEKKYGIATKTLINVSVCASATLTIIDELYFSYFYNNKNIIFPIIYGLAVIGIPLYAIDLSYRAALRKLGYSGFEKKINNLKEDMHSKLLENKSHILLLSNSERKQYYREIKKCNSLSEELSVSLNLLEIFPNLNIAIKMDQPSRRIENFASVSTAVMTTALAADHFVVGYKSANFISDSSYFCYGAGTFNLLISLYVNATVLKERYVNFFHDTTSHPIKILSGHSITGILSPELRKLAGAITIISVGLSAIGCGLSLKDCYEGTTLTLMRSTIPIGIMLTNLHSMEYVIDQVINYIINKKGSKEQKRMLDLEHFFDNISNLIELSSCNVIADLIKELPDNMLNNLVSKHDVQLLTD